MSRWLFDAMEEVGDRVAQAEHLLLCLDFDGTLTPIVEDPATAYLSPPMQRVLRSLAGHKRVSLAIISGRERSDLQAHVGIPGLIYAGNHGLEISGPGCLFVEPTAASHCEALKEFAAALTKKLRPIPGAFVEDKNLTLSVHYRRVAAADEEKIRRIVQEALAGTNDPFLLTFGDKVFEIRPRVSWNKGTAVGWIKEQLGKPDALAIYLGNDVTDEDAFAALPEGITVKVGSVSETAAHYQVESPAEVGRFLGWMESLLRPKTACVAATEEEKSKVQSSKFKVQGNFELPFGKSATSISSKEVVYVEHTRPHSLQWK
jgi:trehalose-phosphatase